MSDTAKLLIIVALVAVGVTVGAGLFFFYIDSTNIKTAEIEQRVQELKNNQEELESVQNSLQNNQFDTDRLDSYLVPSDGVPSFLSTIESLSTSTGAQLTIESVENLNFPNSDQAEILELRLSLSGDWSSVYQTISLLETLPLKLTVNTLNLSSQNQETGAITWTGSLRLEVLRSLPTENND